MKAGDEKVGRFIGNSDTVFIIPPFQRNYSWDEEQCSELFDDILDSVKKLSVKQLLMLKLLMLANLFHENLH